MKIEKRFVVPFPCGRVWAFFYQTDAVVRCLPGAELMGKDADGHLAGRFSVKLGPIAAAFSGEAEITAQFAENLQVALAAEAPVPIPAPLDAGNLLTHVIWTRVWRWLKRLFGHG
jgi:carbon monoxide dehydrogenase subunit G